MAREFTTNPADAPINPDNEHAGDNDESDDEDDESDGGTQ